MKQILNYVIIGFIGLAILNGCKKKSDEEKSEPETKIVVNTTVSGIGETQGVEVTLYRYNAKVVEISDSNGKAVFEDAEPGTYYGSAYYVDSNNHDYRAQIGYFSLSKDETEEINITLH